MEFKSVIGNQGAGVAAATDFQVFLTLDPQSGPAGDIVLGAGRCPSLAAGGSGDASVKIKWANAGVGAGTYYVGLKADSGGVLDEGNEKNNSFVFRDAATGSGHGITT